MRLRLILALHLLFFAGWGVSLLVGHRDAEVLWLETVPVDPRDYLSGHYVALRYAAATPDVDSCKVLLLTDDASLKLKRLDRQAYEKRRQAQQNRRAYLRFGKSAQSVQLKEGGAQRRLATVVACRGDRPEPSQTPEAAGSSPPGSVWVQATVSRRDWQRELRFHMGIERFFVNEDSPLRTVRSGDVVARVAVNRKYKARIVDLEMIVKTPDKT